MLKFTNLNTLMKIIQNLKFNFIIISLIFINNFNSAKIYLFKLEYMLTYFMMCVFLLYLINRPFIYFNNFSLISA